MNVYVLGAGASRHAGYPLASELGSKLRQWCEGRNDARDLASVLDHLDGGLHGLEQLLTDADAGRITIPAWPQCRALFQQGIREFFRSVRPHEAVGYRGFSIGRIQPGDTVITFNYDVSLERELRRAAKWSVEDGYGFPITQSGPQRSPARVLKLHGSANWIAFLFGGLTSGFAQIDPWKSLGGRPVIPTDELRFLGYEDLEDEMFRGGAYLTTMILPTYTKKFSFTTNFGRFELFWDSLWGQASSCLQNAASLVLAGYSMPAADDRARALLLENCNKHVECTILCGGDTARIGTELRAAGYSNLRLLPRITFEEWAAEAA
jgi:hypothetical protein